MKNQSERAKKKTKAFKKTKMPPAPSHDPGTIDGPMYPLFTHKESVNRVHTNDSHHTVHPWSCIKLCIVEMSALCRVNTAEPDSRHERRATNSRLKAQTRQLPQNSNLTCSNSTQVQETANNAEVLPCAAGDHFFMRWAAGATPRTGPWVRATRPRSLQAPHTWWTRWYRALSSSSSTKSSVLPQQWQQLGKAKLQQNK